MFNKLEVSTEGGNTLSLSLYDPSKGYIIKDISGLDPVRAAIVSSTFADMDGEQYHASRREKRNIVIKLDIKQEFTSMSVSELRSQLYTYFMPRTNLRMRFFDTSNKFLEIYGMVESFDSLLFTKNPEVAITLQCFNPDFYNPLTTKFQGRTTQYDTELAVDYAGTVESGMTFSMVVGRNVSAFTIHHRPAAGLPFRSLEFRTTLISGDRITINTNPGSKSALRTRDGVISSLLYGVTPASIWTTLFPGRNYIRVNASGTGMTYSLEWNEKYGAL